MPTPEQPGSITNSQLNFGYWYVTHKIQLKKWLVIFLIVLSVFLYGYSIYKAVMILVVEEKNYRSDLNSLTSKAIDYPYFHDLNQPKAIEIISFDAILGREGKSDFVVKVQNPNEKWLAAKVSYQLLSGNLVVEEKSDFIYPGEEKYLAFFGQAVAASDNPTIKIAKVDWFRVNNFTEVSQPKLKFTVTDTQFKSALESGIHGELPVSILTFKIANDSAYGYWQVGVYMILLNGERVVGANYLDLDQFKSGETRNLDIRWYEPIAAVSQVIVLPAVNIFDPAVFMPVK
ncbi:MAG: hypothetical protein WC768_05235 [Patescibacteria group bacterium]|jgi:hypothetical protein